MKRLLSIELQKIWMNKASRILTLTYFILLSFIALIASIKFDIGPFKFHLAEMGIFNFPFIWHFNTYVAAWLKFFLAIVIVSMMANEYSYGTLKQNLIDGLSKKEFILSKFLTVVLFAFGSTVFIFILSLILGLFYSSYTEFSIIFSDLDYLLAFFVKLTGFFSFCLFLGILVKRSAFALGFLLVWSIIEGIIKGTLAFKIFPDSNTDEKIMQFLPLEAMSNLIVNPGPRLSVVKNIGSQIGIETDIDYSINYTAIFIVLAWTFIFISSAYKLLKNRDL
ncbi:ABC-type transport system involved in multi-copper enzyme maturation permease subunit [Flavobacterium nitrogenifigens]|uniref:ABC-type transport system involved in multi-copper enzyme maturation permease subunit n=2 Tax=Flavobacterium TaxID=237 RepID=A0A7W7N6A7_9FLAO|nr:MULTISPECIES: ABC transporter permease subunit [Flavobacterium]MBB4801468.1 ABC-type transport system involved in multi-copper enzyme maturation permease subunit [Flavobacterium nitrogenifigens]MBB6386425.1 ABC-type transport system involved in multi-copper enzyme maturation permease subunit [Flavobacterium notoginsengisoli]